MTIETGNNDVSTQRKMRAAKCLQMVLLCLLLCLLAAACSGDEGNGSDSGDGSGGITAEPGKPTEAVKNSRAFFDPFLNNMTMTEKYAFIPRGSVGARYFDVASRSDVLFCFEPNCEHQGLRYDDRQKNVGDHCAAWCVGDSVFYLTGDYGYYFQWPNLVQTDRQGMNQKTIGKVDEPLDSQFYQLYTDQYYFTTAQICYEHTKVEEEDGSERWLLGDRLEKEIGAVVMMSLTDGTSKFIFRDEGHYSGCVSDLYEYQNHVYFINTYLDVPFESLRQTNADRTDWLEVDIENSKHFYVELYDYDIAADELKLILRRDKQRTGFRFGDGYILQFVDGYSEEGPKLYKMNGEFLADLPWSVGDRIITDGTPIFTYWKDNVRTLRMYDIEKGEVLREIIVNDGEFNLHVAVGDSYYGTAYSGDGTCRMAYIAAEDYWNHAFDRAVLFKTHPGDE